MAEHDEWKSAHKVACELFKVKETEVDMTQYAGADSDFLKSEQIKGKNPKVVISSVGTHTFPAQDDKPETTKATLSFNGKDKGLVLNATNTKALIAAYGADSEGWVGKEIGLTTKHYDSFGVDGIVVAVLDTPFDDDIPF